MSTPARSSAMPGYEACYGRPAAEVGLPESTNAIADRGVKIHDSLHSNDFSKLTPDEMDSAQSIIRMTADVQEAVVGPFKVHTVLKEHPIAVLEQGTPVITGHPDRVVLWADKEGEECALITDAKTGFLEVESAELNLQLLCYALGIWQERKIKRIYAKIIMPMAKRDEHKVVVYDEGALQAGLEYVLSILAETRKPDAERTPSEVACRYCKALGTSRCPETSQIVETVAVEQIEVFTPEKIAERLERFKIAEKIIEKEEALFKAMLEKDENAIPGWFLKPGNVIDKIVNAQKAFEIVEPILKEHVPGPAEAVDDQVMAIFQGCVSVAKGKLEAALSDATGLKGKALDDRFDQLFSSVIVKTQNKPSLSKMSKAMLTQKGLK